LKSPRRTKPSTGSGLIVFEEIPQLFGQVLLHRVNVNEGSEPREGGGPVAVDGMNPSSPHSSWTGCRRASQNSLNWLSNRGANRDCASGVTEWDRLMVFEKIAQLRSANGALRFV
jgi:hypothetical protein